VTIKTLTNQTIALAGVAQSVQLVQSIARIGTVGDTDELETCVSSVLKINSDSVIDVYGGLDRLKTGLQVLKRQLGSGEGVDQELARYAASLLVLEQKLHESPLMQRAIRDGVDLAATKAAHFGLVHDNVFASLADLYQNTISQLRPRVMVQGEPAHLNHEDKANRIRTLLLAGIRSLVLWRQCGGSRWKFLFQRQRMLDEVWRLQRSL
jgi:high frequency lysogenization protein